jgi:two-component system sensor histidine kinase KdpD
VTLRVAVRLRAVAVLLVSISAVILTGEICRRLPHINQTAVALALLLVLELISINVGLTTALISAVFAGADLLYIFARLHGWRGVGTVEGVTIATFLAVAIITIRLSDQAKAGTMEAARRADEMARLHKFGQEILPAENSTATIEKGLSAAVNIFGIDGIAFCMLSSGELFRAGPASSQISDSHLQSPALSWADHGPSDYTAVSVDGRDGPLGILAFCGSKPSMDLLGIIGSRLAVSLERAVALERSTEVEAARRCAELEAALLDSLAHDMKTPLATMKVSLASLLSMKQQLPDAYLSFLSIIDEEVDRLNTLMGEALNRGSLDHGSIGLARESHPVENLVAATLREMGNILGTRPIIVNIPDELPEVCADIGLMKQVLKQLIDNAVKYTPPGSPLTISSNERDGMITIEIADHGPGVPELEREYVFEKYYRGQNCKDKAGGLGLGLAIARTIVRAHGGQIWVTSNNGAGSIFHLAIPAMELVA